MRNWLLLGILLMIVITSCSKHDVLTERHDVTYKIVVYDFDEEFKYKLDDPSSSFSSIKNLGVCEYSLYKSVGDTCFMEVACRVSQHRVDFVMQILVNGVEMKSFHYSSDQCGNKDFEMKYILFSDQITK